MLPREEPEVRSPGSHKVFQRKILRGRPAQPLQAVRLNQIRDRHYRQVQVPERDLSRPQCRRIDFERTGETR